MNQKVYDVSFFSVKANEEGTLGQVEALVAVIGNVDKVGDRIVSGAVDQSLVTWRKSGDPIPMVWNHDWSNPMSHIGYWDPHLSQEVQATDQHPAGLLLKGFVDINQGNPIADQAYRLMKGRRIKEFSIGYKINPGGESRASDGAHELKSIDLVEAGPTLKGVNQSTQLMNVKSEDLEYRGKLDDARVKLKGYMDAVDTKGDDPEVEEQLIEALESISSYLDLVDAKIKADEAIVVEASDELIHYSDDEELEEKADEAPKKVSPEKVASACKSAIAILQKLADSETTSGTAVVEACKSAIKIIQTLSKDSNPKPDFPFKKADEEGWVDGVNAELGYENKALDESAFDGNSAMSMCVKSDNPAAAFAAVCAGKTDGDPNTREGWRLPHHMSPNADANIKGVAAALGRLDQAPINNPEEARKHLEAHQAEIDAMESKSEVQSIDNTDIQDRLNLLALEVVEVNLKHHLPGLGDHYHPHIWNGKVTDAAGKVVPSSGAKLPGGKQSRPVGSENHPAGTNLSPTSADKETFNARVHASDERVNAMSDAELRAAIPEAQKAAAAEYKVRGDGFGVRQAELQRLIDERVMRNPSGAEEEKRAAELRKEYGSGPSGPPQLTQANYDAAERNLTQTQKDLARANRVQTVGAHQIYQDAAARSTSGISAQQAAKNVLKNGPTPSASPEAIDSWIKDRLNESWSVGDVQAAAPNWSQYGNSVTADHIAELGGSPTAPPWSRDTAPRGGEVLGLRADPSKIRDEADFVSWSDFSLANEGGNGASEGDKNAVNGNWAAIQDTLFLVRQDDKRQFTDLEKKKLQELSDRAKEVARKYPLNGNKRDQNYYINSYTGAVQAYADEFINGTGPGAGSGQSKSDEDMLAKVVSLSLDFTELQVKHTGGGLGPHFHPHADGQGGDAKPEKPGSADDFLLQPGEVEDIWNIIKDGGFKMSEAEYQDEIQKVRQTLRQDGVFKFTPKLRKAMEAGVTPGEIDGVEENLRARIAPRWKEATASSGSPKPRAGKSRKGY